MLSVQGEEVAREVGFRKEIYDGDGSADVSPLRLWFARCMRA